MILQKSARRGNNAVGCGDADDRLNGDNNAIDTNGSNDHTARSV